MFVLLLNTLTAGNRAVCVASFNTVFPLSSPPFHLFHFPNTPSHLHKSISRFLLSVFYFALDIIYTLGFSLERNRPIFNLCVWFILLHTMDPGLIHLLQMTQMYPSFWLSGTPLCSCTTFCLSFTCCWVDSLLFLKFLWTECVACAYHAWGPGFNFLP